MTVTVRTLCVDCGVDTRATDERFMVHDWVWAAVAGHTCWPACYDTDPWAEHPASLCLDCVEARLGRTLNRGDFTGCPLNLTARNPRLRERMRA